MKTINLIILISFWMVNISGAQNSGDFTVPFSDPAKRGKVKAHLNSGSITIKGTPRKDVLVKYSTLEKAHGKVQQGKDGMKKISGGTVDLEVSESNNFIKISSGSWNNELNLEIEVPANVDLQVHTYNDGILTIQSVQGELELSNYNGEIYAYNISGSVVATSYNGEIKVTFDKVTEGAPMSFSTYNGDVDLTFPGSLKSSLKMKTNQGEIFTDFDVTMVKSGPVQKKDEKSGVYKVTVDDWVKGDVNGGGPEFMIKTYNGDIFVRKK
ncbi:MAG: DUF4097 family beta strand repeat protein [Cyclobacteriaceae bacterium]|nr:DUF4097 family beta strand repeat protein [Cyclobacteriaceae bacterium]